MSNLKDVTSRSIVVLTGAGISAESGLETFRDPDGIWAKHDIRQIATPAGFEEDPDLVHSFYNSQRKASAAANPNPAHVALARLEEAWTGPFLLVTQNIDGLHEKAGSTRLVHMHGQLDQAICRFCHNRPHWQGDLTVESECPVCKAEGGLRPDIVWFGEMPYHMDQIYEALAGCDLFLSIGTSGTVYPAADFVRQAKRAGAFTVELNLEASRAGSGLFDDEIEGAAGKTVPRFVEELVDGGYRFP